MVGLKKSNVFVRYFLNFIIFVLLQISATSGQALGLGVQLANLEANYEFASIDLPWAMFVHEYRSKNSYENSLGPGWCNGLHIKTPNGPIHINIEANLIIEDQKLTLQDCGSKAQIGLATVFSARIGDKKSIKDRAKAGEQFVLRDSDESGMAASVSKDGVLISFGLLQAARQFDWNGTLTAVGSIKIISIDKQISRLEADGQAVELKYENNRLISISASTGTKARFRFEKNILTEIDNAWLKKYQFIFDDLFNLESVIYPDKTSYIVFYDKSKDVVTSLLHRNGCMEPFSAITTEDKNNYKIQTSLVCNEILQSQKTEIFRFNSDGKLSNAGDKQWDKESHTIRHTNN